MACRVIPKGEGRPDPGYVDLPVFDRLLDPPSTGGRRAWDRWRRSRCWRHSCNGFEIMPGHFDRLTRLHIAGDDYGRPSSDMPRHNPSAHIADRDVVELFDQTVGRMSV